MIANLESAAHLRHHSAKPEPRHVICLELQLDQIDQISDALAPCLQGRKEKVRQKTVDETAAGSGNAAVRLMGEQQKNSLGIAAVKIGDIINRQLLKIQSPDPTAKLQITKTLREEAGKGAEAASEGEKTLTVKLNTPRGRKFTRESSALTNTQQNNKVQLERIPQHASSIFMCPICSRDSQEYKEESCFHRFCLECLRGHLRQNINDGNFIILCPEQNCEEKLSIQNIQHLLENNEFQIFVHFYRKTIDERNLNNKFCPKVDCGDILQKLDSKMNCKTCKSVYCALCLQPDHLSATCDSALKENLEQTFEIYNIKKCPKCSSPIEKEYGCNHIQCRTCKYEFCWICLKKYTHFHYKYYNCFGCPGMQFENQTDLCLQRALKIALYSLLPFLAIIVVLCYLSSVPFYICINLIGKPFSWIHERCDFIEATVVEKGCHCLLYFDCGEFVCSFLLWILYQPRAIIFAVFVSPVRLGKIIQTEICKFFQ